MTIASATKVYGPMSYLVEEINELLNHYRAAYSKYFPSIERIGSLGKEWYRIAFTVPKEDAKRVHRSITGTSYSHTRMVNGYKICMVGQGRIIHVDTEVFDYQNDTANWHYWTNVATIVALPNGGFAVRGVRIDYNCPSNSQSTTLYYSSIKVLTEKMRKRGIELDEFEIGHLSK